MTRLHRNLVVIGAVTALGWVAGCSDGDESGDGTGGAPNAAGGSGGGAVSSGGAIGAGGAGGASAGGITGSSGASGAGGGPSSGGAGGAGTGGSAGSTGSGGTAGGTASGGTAGVAGSGGTPGSGGAGGATGCGTGSGTWPAVNPSQRGPYTVATENNVGPNSSYTMFRPQTLGEAGLKHPVITWGNGTSTTPATYRAMLTHYASHGFVVIASNSMNVGQGTPPPMLDGVTWVLQQAGVSSSPLYNCIDASKIGATGHSQGAFATVSAGSDPRIVTIAPLQGARANTNLHGPAAFFCGGMDETLPCSGHTNAFNGVTGHPVMLANHLSSTHTNWIRGGATHPYAVATTGWFRVHLMGDTALRTMFYGANCTLCQDTATWQIQRKMMD